VSAKTTSSAPPAASSSANPSTRAGSTAPSKGHPNETPIVTVARMRFSCARSTIRFATSTDSSGAAFWLRRLNVSLAANAKCTSSRPVSRRRSYPRSFSARPA
jgi:hypothetical protein